MIGTYESQLSVHNGQVHALVDMLTFVRDGKNKYHQEGQRIATKTSWKTNSQTVESSHAQAQRCLWFRLLYKKNRSKNVYTQAYVVTSSYY